jgi:hypothetical protein
MGIKTLPIDVFVKLGIFRIFITDDFTLKGKTTSFESVVKSSKIIQGRFEHIPVASLV